MTDIKEIGKGATEAARLLRLASDDDKNRALHGIADALRNESDSILKANIQDMANAKEAGMPKQMLDRLMLSQDRINQMASGVDAVAEWPDPVGKILSEHKLDNGLILSKINVPLGVIGIIFESRPNVTSDCAALCIRAGNAVILRGGKEAFYSNKAISDIMRISLGHSAIPVDSIQLITDTTRSSAREMMSMCQYIDVLIPRGGRGLIRSVIDGAKVPVIQTGAGNCHIYVDKSADLNMATDIIRNAKTSRPSVCNAAEKLLVHRDIAHKFLPLLSSAMSDVEFRGDDEVCNILPNAPQASDDDWNAEYLDLIMAVKVVSSVDEAIVHIEKWSTHHSDSIITQDSETAEKFLSSVDSAAVYHNASTRFTDGGQFGLGAEIGISTQKLHARGPMGVDQLVTYKYIIRGEGQIRI